MNAAQSTRAILNRKSSLSRSLLHHHNPQRVAPLRPEEPNTTMHDEEALYPYFANPTHIRSMRSLHGD